MYVGYLCLFFFNWLILRHAILWMIYCTPRCHLKSSISNFALVYLHCILKWNNDIVCSYLTWLAVTQVREDMQISSFQLALDHLALPVTHVTEANKKCKKPPVAGNQAQGPSWVNSERSNHMQGLVTSPHLQLSSPLCSGMWTLEALLDSLCFHSSVTTAVSDLSDVLMFVVCVYGYTTSLFSASIPKLQWLR